MKKLINKTTRLLIFALLIYIVIGCLNFSSVLSGDTQNLIKNLPLFSELMKYLLGIIFFKFFCKVIFSFIGKY